MGAQAAPFDVRPPINNIHHVMVVVTTVVIVCSSSATRVLGQQENASEALLKFKSSLANANPALDSWEPGTPPCTGSRSNWEGVLCFNGYVWGLQLENMNLRGQIDVNSLVSLPFLRTLSFRNNSFQGMMPDWRKLGALKSLYLSDNQFSGQIADDAFRGMTSLKKVYLSNNKFTGRIPASIGSPKLVELALDNNQFTGSIPVISYDVLKVFNVSNNQLDGPIPAPLLKMDPSSFSGNKGLCGKPLGSTCDPPIPPPDLEPTLISPPVAMTPPADTNFDGSPTNGKKSSSSLAKIAILIISVLLILFLFILLFLLCRRSRNNETPQTGRESSPEKSATMKVVATASAQVNREVNKSGRKGEQPQQQQAGKLSFVRDDRQKFDLQDLMRASAEVLGSGNFGASYKAVLVDGEALVVKRFKQMNNIAREDFHEHMRRLGRLKHPNLLPLVAYLYRKEEKLLVFDHVSNGSLATYLHGKRSEEKPVLSWAKRLKIIKGVAKGLMYLYGELPSLTVPHGHLKSSNVLLDDDFNPLLMDYTLGPVVNPNQVHQVLVAYKCPEYAQSGRTSKKTDVWCLGILILETLTGKLVAKYLGQGRELYGVDLSKWINNIVEEDINQVFDKEMEISSEHNRVEMEKLLKIGIACCQEDLDKRLDFEEALKKIEQVHE